METLEIKERASLLTLADCFTFGGVAVEEASFGLGVGWLGRRALRRACDEPAEARA